MSQNLSALANICQFRLIGHIKNAYGRVLDLTNRHKEGQRSETNSGRHEPSAFAAITRLMCCNLLQACEVALLCCICFGQFITNDVKIERAFRFVSFLLLKPASFHHYHQQHTLLPVALSWLGFWEASRGCSSRSVRDSLFCMSRLILGWFLSASVKSVEQTLALSSFSS